MWQNVEVFKVFSNARMCIFLEHLHKIPWGQWSGFQVHKAHADCLDKLPCILQHLCEYKAGPVLHSWKENLIAPLESEDWLTEGLSCPESLWSPIKGEPSPKSPHPLALFLMFMICCRCLSASRTALQHPEPRNRADLTHLWLLLLQLSHDERGTLYIDEKIIVIIKKLK